MTLTNDATSGLIGGSGVIVTCPAFSRKDTTASTRIARASLRRCRVVADLTRAEILEKLEEHEHKRGISSIVSDWCDRCGVRWPCDDAQILTMALDALTVLDRYLSLRREVEALANELERPHDCHGCDGIANRLRAVLPPESPQGSTLMRAVWQYQCSRCARWVWRWDHHCLQKRERS